MTRVTIFLKIPFSLFALAYKGGPKNDMVVLTKISLCVDEGPARVKVPRTVSKLGLNFH